MMVWAEHESNALDEREVQERLGRGWQIRRIGRCLFVAIQVESAEAAEAEDDVQVEASPLDQAKELYAAARKAGDCHKQASPLIDLGVICVRNGKVPQAIELLQRRLTIARTFNDLPLISDAQINLATALVAGDQPERARDLLETELALARESGDRFQEKLVLGHLGAVQAKVRDHGQAVLLYERALTLASEVADRHHQAELLWHLAIQHAALGQHERAIANAQAGIKHLQDMGDPKAASHLEFLKKYRLDAVTNGFSEPEMIPLPCSGGLNQPVNTSVTAELMLSHGPGLLRMALSAAKSMAEFLGSGLKTVPHATYQERLETCGTCPHHTGVRCKLCGCFTKVKARLPHETCPLAKWPS